MEKEVKNAVGSVVETLINTGARKATKYLSPKLVVRACLRGYDGKAPKKGNNPEIMLVIGRPNAVQKEFIAKCVKAGEPFPVKKVQLNMWPKRK